MARRFGWLGVLALVLVSTGANSLGLGEIKLNSYLNEKLDAEIQISLSGADELSSLKVQIAPLPEFDRVGIDRPAFLSGLKFTVERLAGDRALIRIRSDQPIMEPFVTFLIEATWQGGRLLREYTVLLDPPLFLPTPEPPAVDAPVPARDSAASGMVQRPAPAPARPVAEPRPAPVINAPTSYGPVQRSETLWGIAQEVRPDPAISTNQMMMALFRANPDAFDGNINRMRAGARLRVPGRDEILGVSAAEATAEVRRQNTRWRSASTAAAGSGATAAASAPARPQVSDEPRLELVPPSEPGTQGAAAVGQASSEQEALNQELLNAVQSLRGELDATREAISIKDAEIAALQQRLAAIDGGQVATGEELEAEFDPDSVQRAVAEAEAEAAVAAAEQAAAETAESGAEEALVEEEIVAAESAQPEPSPAVSKPPAAQISGGQDDGGLLSSVWVWIAGFAALLAALFFVWKRRQEAGTEEAFEAWEPKPEREPKDPAETSPAILVEEQTHPGAAGLAAAGVTAAAAADAGLDFGDTEAAKPKPKAGQARVEPPVDEPTGADYQYPFEDTIAGATGINLEQSDPLAEADFHMAYGLYDQAADLIRKAIGREPDRVDLRLKMLDILFVWGKSDEFVTEAQALQELGSAEPSEWSRVAIMGRQIAPDQPLFEDQGAGHAGVDVAVSGDGEEGSEAGPAGADDLDFDFGESEPGEESKDDDVLDFDIGATGELPAPAPWDATQEREVMPDATAEMEIEDLGLDVNLEDLEESTRGPDDMDIEGTGITEIIVRDDDSRFLDIEASDTEVLEDENSNTGTIDADSGDTEILEKAVTDEDDETGITEMLEAAEELASDVSGAYSVEELEDRNLDEDTREMPQVEEPGADAEAGGTSVMKALELPEEESAAESSEDDTAEVKALEEDDDAGLDLEDITAALGRDLEKTAEMPVAGSAEDAETLIADIFGDDEATRVAPRQDILRGADEDSEATREMPRVEIPDVTLSEVGTKLDLARAYIDMGDPDGARSILGEVLEEGDDGQKSEAKDLLDGLG